MVKQVLWSESVRDRIDSGKPHFLARACLKALSAGAGSVLLDVAATDRPDLIVLAPEASDMGAPELCRRIRQDDRTRGIPILALASDDTQEFLFREAGCTEVVRASIPAALLQEKIAAMLGMRLRQHPRYPVVLPVARGRFIREFLGFCRGRRFFKCLHPIDGYLHSAIEALHPEAGTRDPILAERANHRLFKSAGIELNGDFCIGRDRQGASRRALPARRECRMGRGSGTGTDSRRAQDPNGLSDSTLNASRRSSRPSRRGSPPSRRH